MSAFLDSGLGPDVTAPLKDATPSAAEIGALTTGLIAPVREPIASAIPKVSLSTLARASGPMSPVALARLLHGHKHASAGPRRSYQCALKQVVDSLVDRVPIDPNAPLRKHEREAVQAYVRTPLRIGDYIRRRRPARAEPWLLHGINVTMHPDVELVGRVESGAVKLIFTKDRLPRGVGTTMAALLWYWRRHVLGDETTKTEHCIVYEPRLPYLHRPGRNPARQIASLELACRTIAALWPVV